MPGPNLDQLFAAPPPTFVAERKLLVDKLRASGQSKEAKDVQNIPRPSVSAWIVNQLARNDAPLLKRFAETTARLQGGQTGASAEQTNDRPGGLGAHSGGLGAHSGALGAHRDALKQLRARAEEILVLSGQAVRPQILERVVRNLRIGFAREETRRTIESGRLIHDVEDQDFATLLGQPFKSGETTEPAEQSAGGGLPGGRPKKVPAGAQAQPDRRARAKAERESAARARDEARVRARVEAERERARAEADRRLRALRAESEAAQKVLQKQERFVELARKQLVEAEASLRQARLESARAGEDLQAAESAVVRQG